MPRLARSPARARSLSQINAVAFDGTTIVTGSHDMTARVWSAQECALNAESVCASRQLGCVRVSWCSRLHLCVRVCVRRRAGRSGFCVRTAGVLVGDRLGGWQTGQCTAVLEGHSNWVTYAPIQLGHGAPRNTVPPLAAWWHRTQPMRRYRSSTHGYESTRPAADLPFPKPRPPCRRR